MAGTCHIAQIFNLQLGGKFGGRRPAARGRKVLTSSGALTIASLAAPGDGRTPTRNSVVVPLLPPPGASRGRTNLINTAASARLQPGARTPTRSENCFNGLSLIATGGPLSRQRYILDFEGKGLERLGRGQLNHQLSISRGRSVEFHLAHFTR